MRISLTSMSVQKSKGLWREGTAKCRRNVRTADSLTPKSVCRVSVLNGGGGCELRNPLTARSALKCRGFVESS